MGRPWWVRNGCLCLVCNSAICSQTTVKVITVLQFCLLIEWLMDCFVALQRSSTQGSHRIRLLVHQSQAGGVIGKSGSKIKELREVLTSFFLLPFSGNLLQTVHHFCCIHHASFLRSVLWHYWLGIRKSVWPVKKLSDEMLARLSVWSMVQMICIWSSWYHCHPTVCCFVKI